MCDWAAIAISDVKIENSRVRALVCQKIKGVAIGPEGTGYIKSAIAQDVRDEHRDHDLVLNDGKVAGILVELVTPPDQPLFAIIGIGINANLTAEELPPTDRLPATSLLVEGGVEIDRIALLERLGDGLDAALAQFDRDGFASFVPRYAALDGLAGHMITLKLPQESRAGTAVGIDASGRLILRLADGSEQTFSAGEVERVLD